MMTYDSKIKTVSTENGETTNVGIADNMPKNKQICCHDHLTIVTGNKFIN